MRGLLLGFMCLCSLETVGYCQTLYLIAAGDVKDRGVGRVVANTQEYLVDMFDSRYGGMPRENIKVIYPSKDYPNSTSGKALVIAIERLVINLGDSILMFYVGHGGFDVGTRTHWLFFSDGKLARSDVEIALRRHRDKASVCALVTDTCTPVPR